MSRRKVTSDELKLWRHVTANTEPLAVKSVKEPVSEPATEPRFVPTPVKPAASSVLKAQQKPLAVSYDLAEQLSTRLETAPVQMDHKAFKRMKRGKLKPEARIDLHGKTLDRAHPVLIRFILAAVADDKRLVLVITGKGRDRDNDGPIPSRRGALRHQLPQWLTTPPLASHVIQFSPAHISHGGEGAFYVYLRRQR